MLPVGAVRRLDDAAPPVGNDLSDIVDAAGRYTENVYPTSPWVLARWIARGPVGLWNNVNYKEKMPAAGLAVECRLHVIRHHSTE
ncbi:uncharacterized protein LDX57_003249 [Aspergillus melleus]|uniref:uncharacterized protein n=1 Tax=Aspergillus melleus TaxID=138277 RepID=UPI001E8DAD04|nr:uncharacterized protein LDX57_003249 [Aspergillus melleus]KAH8425498.1 hypothetical protein LDX57_003249 [Aspergillus melleus]